MHYVNVRDYYIQKTEASVEVRDVKTDKQINGRNCKREREREREAKLPSLLRAVLTSFSTLLVAFGPVAVALVPSCIPMIAALVTTRKATKAWIVWVVCPEMAL